ncbi:MAG TPA: hypothetical protein VK982_12030 [Bacteroidales bacterium]|nr:hypothetical protein [Bacteroidales bacterium]
MGITELYQHFNVDYKTGGNKHCTAGWANIHCPFCPGSDDYHLGVHIRTGRFYCWRCGWKPTPKAIAKIIGVSEQKAKELIRQYKINTGSKSAAPEQKEKIQFKPHRLPKPYSNLQKQHKKYLKKRGFDPDYLEQEWGLLGTGPVSYLDKIDYKNRIIIPIFWKNQQVSFQTRDITGKSDKKYIACPKVREKILHQDILYGKNWSRDTAICVEGVTDVWKLGDSAFAVFGIGFRQMQVRLIAKMFKRVIILFDEEPQAIKQGEILKAELAFRGVDVHQEILKGKDPGDMEQDDADYLVKQLLRKWK